MIVREKLQRTILSLAVVIGAVFAARWTIRAAMARAYRPESAAGEVEMPFVPAPRIWSLAELVPEELHGNLAGLAVRQRAKRLGMPYALAVDVADEMAVGEGWKRLDNPNALTVKNLSGMERIYRTPEGSIVLREVRPIVGDDAIMKDFILPVEMLPEPDEQTTPDELARRSARRVKELMPEMIRDVVVGSPLLTQLIKRGGGAALLVHSVAETPAEATAMAINAAARKGGWTTEASVFQPGNPLTELTPEGQIVAKVAATRRTKGNLTFCYEVLPRETGGCDVNYRFADDEVCIPRKEQKHEN